MEKPLLILDLDETLIRSVAEPLDRPPEFVVADYNVYFRPGVSDFLKLVGEHYTLGIWSSATMAYVAPIAINLWRGLADPLFVWDRDRCTQRFDFFRHEEFYVKDLRKVERNGVSLRRMLIVDDEFRKVSLQIANAVLIKPFHGDLHDRELADLGRFLVSIKDEPDMQRISKGRWCYRAGSGK